MTKQELVQTARSKAGGAWFMTASEFAEWLGVSREAARRKLYGVQKSGTRYYIPDIVDRILAEVD